MKKFIIKISFYTIMFGISFSANSYLLEFDDRLEEKFSNIKELYTETNFTNSWNHFGGIIFWQGVEELDDFANVEFYGTSNWKECAYRIKWLYFNPQRWNYLIPLDTDSLEKLRDIDSFYDSFSIAWGWFAGCEDDQDEYIYGQVSNTIAWVEYSLTAWVKKNWLSYTGKFEENISYNWEIGSWYFFDSYGWRGTSIKSGEYWITPDDFSFSIVKNAELDEYYNSDTIEIKWLWEDTKSIARILEDDRWELIINWDRFGKEWYVQNWDEIQIKLKSNEEFDSITSASVKIWLLTKVFYIETMSENWESFEWEISIGQKFLIMSIFKDLVDNYEWWDAKLTMFLYTFKSMLEDKIDLLDDEQSEEWEILEYLLNLMESHMMNSIGTPWVWSDLNSDTYIAPNCKTYKIEYDEIRAAYYSPNFIVPHFFATQESMKNYIDEYNPWDWYCWDSIIINDSVDDKSWTAPNGKKYQITKTAQWYTSYDFINIKFFDSLQTIRRYIDMNNPRIAVWDHTIDNSQEPQIYKPANGKEYEILLTNRGYMSYKFLKVMYFDTLDWIKAYIDKWNGWPWTTNNTWSTTTTWTTQ